MSEKSATIREYMRRIGSKGGRRSSREAKIMAGKLSAQVRLMDYPYCPCCGRPAGTAPILAKLKERGIEPHTHRKQVEKQNKELEELNERERRLFMQRWKQHTQNKKGKK